MRAVAVRAAAARESEEMALVAERAEERRCWKGWRREDLETLAQLDARLHAAAQLDARLGPLAVVLCRPDRADAAHRTAAGGGSEREQHGGSHRTREGNSEGAPLPGLDRELRLATLLTPHRQHGAKECSWRACSRRAWDASALRTAGVPCARCRRGRGRRRRARRRRRPRRLSSSRAPCSRRRRRRSAAARCSLAPHGTAQHSTGVDRPNGYVQAFTHADLVTRCCRTSTTRPAHSSSAP